MQIGKIAFSVNINILDFQNSTAFFMGLFIFDPKLHFMIFSSSNFSVEAEMLIFPTKCVVLASKTACEISY